MIPDTPYTDNYTLYILKNGDEKEDGCYEYNNNSISEKLFRHIIDDEVKGIDNISKRTDGYIDLDDLKDLNIKEVYYIALYQKDDNVKTTSSVENKLKGVSISKLININELEQ